MGPSGNFCPAPTTNKIRVIVVIVVVIIVLAGVVFFTMYGTDQSIMQEEVFEQKLKAKEEARKQRRLHRIQEMAQLHAKRVALGVALEEADAAHTHAAGSVSPMSSTSPEKDVKSAAERGMRSIVSVVGVANDQSGQSMHFGWHACVCAE